MSSEALERLRARMQDADRDLLRALDARAGFPRHPWPTIPSEGNRGSSPRLPIDELLLAIAPAGTAADTDAAEMANRRLLDALSACRQLAGLIADARFDVVRADAQAALEIGDRERMAALLTDLPAELKRLEFIRHAAVEFAPNLPGDLAPLLWREYLIPWTQQSEIEHLLAP